MWGQTKELSFDKKIHPTKAGHNPRQSYRPVPTKWLSGKFGLFAIPDEGGKLTSRPTDSAAKTPQQWKQQTELACCKDVIKLLGRPIPFGCIRSGRRSIHDESDTDLLLRSSLLEAGGADHGASTPLAEVYIRTGVSQFTQSVSKTTNHSDWAGWLCHGVRLLRAGPHFGYVFHKDPNQFLHNMECSYLTP